MRFDGVVGYMDLMGDLTPAMPFFRAAEILHFGQKATFGLGEVRCLQMDNEHGKRSFRPTGFDRSQIIGHA